MRRSCSLILSLVLSLGLSACQSAPLAPTPIISPAARSIVPLRAQSNNKNLRFPQDWEGHWRGQCTALGSGGQQRFAPFQMELKLAPLEADFWSWEIIYKGDQINQVRSYQLQVVDAAKGHYVIDENNGIFLDNFTVHGNLLMEQFSVNQSQITGRHELRNGVLEVELSTFSRQALRTSGSGQNKVSSYPLMTLQRCSLTR